MALAPLRAEAQDKSEMTSQLLFGECVRVLSQCPKWLHVKNEYDAYEGWISDKQVTLLPPADYNSTMSHSTHLCEDLSAEAHFNQQTLSLTKGAVLPLFNKGKFQIGQQYFETKCRVIDSSKNKPTQEKLITTALQYINAPYLWGGRSPFGIDCSGFTQAVFRFFGIKLYRDAYQQASQGREIEYINHVQAGDLAFFDNEQKKIIHVGIILPESKIIHASGFVRIDTIDHNGIFNEESGTYSHKLRIIRRIV